MLPHDPSAGTKADERDETGQQRAPPRRTANDERTIIVIEHDMDFVRSYAEWVTVMRTGKLLTAGTVEQVQADLRVRGLPRDRRPMRPRKAKEVTDARDRKGTAGYGRTEVLHDVRCAFRRGRLSRSWGTTAPARRHPAPPRRHGELHIPVA